MIEPEGNNQSIPDFEVEKARKKLEHASKSKHGWRDNLCPPMQTSTADSTALLLSYPGSPTPSSSCSPLPTLLSSCPLVPTLLVSHLPMPALLFSPIPDFLSPLMPALLSSPMPALSSLPVPALLS